ncbi:SGNH/GDSL hydrolase family protein [Enterococcus dongliensis]|uniref:SGNH/GDSL hydrolase family protein n=1 Tax=Enterococcus dongliensis TaxID=2559925 RepID=A0AAW8TF75_9ENTE|nr:SGNH/GDSL hydrolase family protein [Enterococcus dongliensis]MDT2596524.1 SGNH/GDSL hydrolase family protein [Enterococcus dongliensis]MDT2604146.1 SGNH/GDSL hydrolase family protein [Enterococcus dongliensis]MDT2634566.1 SGNH/GDSL hydrolase family protein [Enterococcus dongliensis]MDT2636516.1 SGNH/GDSL hydrolase family protein [Enterococcus dongliensis]MDT2642192.1 SGNH/GDSL hydrolase family protein [Enterococcus dongliensis]
MKKIVLFGDSLLAGVMKGEPSEILNRYILDELTEMGFPGYEVVNLGKRGESSTDGLARVDEAVEAQGDFVVISFGTNDSLRQKNTVEVFGENIKEMIESFDASKVILLTTGYLNTAIITMGDNNRQQRYVQKAKQVAEDIGVNVIDLYHHLTVYPKPNEFIQTFDGIHPSTEGYHFLGALIARDIKEKLLAEG